MTRTVLLFGLILAAAAAVGCGVSERHSGKCVAGPGEKCPSDLFLSNWHEFKALQEKNNKPHLTADERVRMNGLGDVLNQDANAYGVCDSAKPVAGCTNWSPDKERFVVAPPPPAQSLAPTPPAATPAVPPKK